MKEPDRCQVSWGMKSGTCGAIATHRAISTDSSGAVFRVCEMHAKSVRSLIYPDDHFSGMKAGDPLWMIYPPLPESDEWKRRCGEQQKLLADANLVIAELRKQLDAALKPFRGEPFTHSQAAD